MHGIFKQDAIRLTLFQVFKKILCYAIVFSLIGNDMAYAMMRIRASSAGDISQDESSHHRARRRSLPDRSVQEPEGSAADEGRLDDLGIAEQEREDLAALMIQTLIRGKLARNKSARLRREKAKATAVLNIQSYWRGALVRKRVHEAHQAAIEIQRLWKGSQGRKVAAERRQSLAEASALDIQRVWRGKSVRLQIERDRALEEERRVNAVTALQAWFRGRKVRKRLRAEAAELPPAARAASLVPDGDHPHGPPSEASYTSYSAERSGASSEDSPPPDSGRTSRTSSRLALYHTAPLPEGRGVISYGEETPLLVGQGGGGSIQERGGLAERLSRSQRVRLLSVVEGGGHETSPLLFDEDGADLTEGEAELRRIEGRPSCLKWVYMDHLLEKLCYWIALQRGDSEGCCKAQHLWVEGQGIPLESGFHVARGITAFRTGIEYMIFQPVAVILNLLMDYQLYQQFAGHKAFNPLDVVKVWWDGDEASIRGVLSVLVRNPENAKYFYLLFALPPLWGLANVARLKWNTRKETPHTFHETIERVRAYSQPRPNWYSGLWADKLRWIFPFPSMDGDVGDLVYGLLLDGTISIDERREAFNAVVHFTRNATGLAKISGMNGLMRLAVGTAVDQLALVERTHGTAYKNAVLAEKIRALEELRRHNPGLRRAGLKGAIHNLYANYLRWAMRDFNGKANAAAWTTFKTAKLALMVYLYIEIAQQIIAFLKCPKPLEQGFSAAMQPTEFASRYDQGCFNAYLSVFNKVPGQPPETFVSIMPRFKLDPTFTTFNLSYAGASGEQVAGLLMGLRRYQPQIHLTDFDLRNNTISTEFGMTAVMEALKSFQDAAPPGMGVRYLNMSGNAIGKYSDAATVVFGNGLSHFTDLEELDVSGNNIGFTADEGTVAIGRSLGKLSKLQVLDFSGNAIGGRGVNGTVAIGESLRYLTELQVLELSGNQLGAAGSEGIIAIGESLKNLLQLRMLDLSNNSIDQGVVRIGDTLSFLTKLQVLNLSSNNIGTKGSKGTVAIGKSLCCLSQLTDLDLSYDSIGGVGQEEGVLAIAASLHALTQLQKLNLAGNNIGGVNGTVALGTNLRFLTQLTDLDLSWNSIGGDREAIAIGQGLLYLTKLKNLNLSQNIIAKGFANLTDSIIKLTDLQSLYVLQPGNPLLSSQLSRLQGFWDHRNSDTDLYVLITAEDVQAYLNSLPNSTSVVNLSGNLPNPAANLISMLFKGLAQLPELQVLDLSNNRIDVLDDKATTTIGGNLHLLTRLQTIDLSKNWIGFMNQKGAVAIGKGLCSLTHLENLYLSNNPMGLQGDEGMVALGECLHFLTRLRNLDLSNNAIGFKKSSGTLAIGNALPALTALQAVDLSGNSIGFNGMNGTIALAEGLAALPSLGSLDLSGNHIGKHGQNGTLALADALPHLTSLQSLDISNNDIGGTGAQDLISALPPLICGNLDSLSFQGNNLTDIQWGPAAQKLQGLYSGQIQQACAANRCFGTPVHVDTNAVRCSGIQPGTSQPPQRALLGFEAAPARAVTLRSIDSDRGGDLVPYEPKTEEAGLVPYKRGTVERFEPGEEDLLILRPTLLEFFTSSIKRGAVFTIVPEALRELLMRGGFSKRTANIATMAAQLGMTFCMTTAYLPTLTGVGVSMGLNGLGMDASASSVIGNTAAIGVSVAQGAIVTPETLVISMGGGMLGGKLAIAAKNKVKSWILEEDRLPRTQAKFKAKPKTIWTHVLENLGGIIWALVIITMLLRDRYM